MIPSLGKDTPFCAYWCGQMQVFPVCLVAPLNLKVLFIRLTAGHRCFKECGSFWTKVSQLQQDDLEPRVFQPRLKLCNGDPLHLCASISKDSVYEWVCVQVLVYPRY